MKGKILLLVLWLNVLVLLGGVNAEEPFTLKWEVDISNYAYLGPVSMDIDGDGDHELFIGGVDQMPNPTYGQIFSIDGKTGDIIWEESIPSYRDPLFPLVIGDLDNDGTYELVHSTHAYSDGIAARNCVDGSIFWEITDHGAHYHQFAIADTDGTGYPYLYVTTDDQCHTPTNARIKKLYGINGTQAKRANGSLAEYPVVHPCYGGISVADLEGDGEYEIILTDRNYRVNNPGNGCVGERGKGVQCFNEDLELQWNHLVLCSSHSAAIVDVNGDSILDVVAMYQCGAYSYTGGVCVIDGSTGEKMPGKCVSNVGIGAHVQPAIHDIDKDGNIELISCFSTYPKVWDLGSWSMDHTFDESCSEPPDFADVMGDGDLEVIVPCGGDDNSIKIYNSTYDEIYSIPGVTGVATVTQDIDGDGLNELIVVGRGSKKGKLLAFDTLAEAPTPRVRTDTPFYSERRLAAGIYIPPIGGGEVNHPPTFSGATPSNNSVGISIGLSALSITINDQDGDLFDWTITTNPNVGSCSQNDDSSGTKSCGVSGLDYDTTYSWTVNADDGKSGGSRQVTYKFTTETDINCEPVHYRKIIIDSGYIDEILSNFPALIHIDAAHPLAPHLAVNTQSNGNDIMFLSLDNTTQYSHEIEHYDDSTGELYAWVKVPSISPSSNTEFWIGYGNASCTNQQNPNNVWNSNYNGVWHMKDETGTQITDSTANANDGTKTATNQPNEINGRVYKAQDYDGADDYISCQDDSSLDITNKITLEAWVNYRDLGSDYRRIIDKSKNTAYSFRIKSEGKIELAGNFGGTEQQPPFSTLGFNQGEWAHVATTYDGSMIKYYINGEDAGSAIPSPAGDIGTNYAPLGIGAQIDGPSYLFNGIIDEARISNVERSAGWLKASYHTVITPDFITVEYGDTNSPPIIKDPIPLSASTGVSMSLSSLEINISDPDGDSLDWTIKTNPDIGSCSANQENGGTKTCSLTSLEYFTTYYWHVSVTDGNSLVNQTFWFVTEQDPTNPMPSVTLVAPANGTLTADTTPTFSYLVSNTDNETINCTLYIDGEPKENKNSTSDGLTTNNITITYSLPPSTYSWQVNCTDGTNNGSSDIWNLVILEIIPPQPPPPSPGPPSRPGPGPIESPIPRYNITYNLSEITKEEIKEMIEKQKVQQALLEAGLDAQNNETASRVASKTKRMYDKCYANMEITRPQTTVTQIDVRVYCTGQTTIKDLVSFVEIPKSFANHSDKVQVTTNPSADITVIEQDPAYSFYHEELVLGKANYTFIVNEIVNRDNVAVEWVQPWFFASEITKEIPEGCGDGIKDEGEECDGIDGVPEYYICTDECNLKQFTASQCTDDGACTPEEEQLGYCKDCEQPSCVDDLVCSAEEQLLGNCKDCEASAIVLPDEFVPAFLWIRASAGTILLLASLVLLASVAHVWMKHHPKKPPSHK